MKSIISFFSSSFQHKLLLFNILAVSLTAVILFSYLTYNFQEITDFSLNENKQGMENTVEFYLTSYADEKATSTWLQLQAAQNNLAILGRTAQKLIDNYDEFANKPDLLSSELFRTDLEEVNGALSSPASAAVDAFAPAPIAQNPGAKELLQISGLLNLSMDAVFDANANNTFLYFVGDRKNPVTRAYPNIHLVEALGPAANMVFWKDFFAESVPGWETYYTNAEMRASKPNPITVESPYDDAAGQGKIVTMFYPLWNQKTNQFAGAVGADISLANVIQNILDIRVGQTGFAFLMNGRGEVIAMPEAGFELLQLQQKTVEKSGLPYSFALLNESADPAVQQISSNVFRGEQGFFSVNLTSKAGEIRNEIVAYASLPALNDNKYQADVWRIVMIVPEDEIYQELNNTYSAVIQRRTQFSTASIALMLAFLVIGAIVSVQFANSVTANLRTLTSAADQVSAKNYDVDLNIKSADEIGQLGRTFQSMVTEIRDYTTNLESKVAERTADLQAANGEITKLNAKLKDENLRLSAELDVARRLQMMVLPTEQEAQAIPFFDISGYMEPADEVGGDYYDVLSIGDSLYMTIGDVTGHGLPSGVIMLMAQTSLLTLSQTSDVDLKTMLAQLNQVIFRNLLRIREDKNMTIALLRYRAGEFEMVGQHETVMICRTDGNLEIIDTMELGFPIGIVDDIQDFLKSFKFKVSPGDVVLLYTDGVTEAESVSGEQYTSTRLQAVLKANHHLDATRLKEAIIQDLREFIGENKVYDDISLLVIKQK